MYKKNDETGIYYIWYKINYKNRLIQQIKQIIQSYKYRVTKVYKLVFIGVLQ